MLIKIDGKTLELKFGFKFIRTLDELTVEKVKGVSPLESALMELAGDNIMVLPMIVKAGLSYLEEIPDDDSIDEALENMAEPGKRLCRVFIDAFMKHALHSTLTKKTVELMDKLLKVEDEMKMKKVDELSEEVMNTKELSSKGSDSLG